MVRVPDTKTHVTSLSGGADWLPLAGRDGASDVYAVGDQVVKLRALTPFEARLLAIAFTDVHGALAPTGLAPELHMMCYDGEVFATSCELVTEPVPALRPAPEDLGAALAEVHLHMAGVPGRSTQPWIGYYGEHHEFSMITPSIEDDELRELGTRLLPHAVRGDVPGPVHYVHRDVHPGNVVIGGRGPCFVDWDLVHIGSALDDLAMTTCLWAAETDAPASDTAERIIDGYAKAGHTRYALDAEPFRSAVALAGLRQGVGAWYSDEGACDAPYWPWVRRRIRAAVEIVCGG
jgi:aminoglycoside phosphotransferase (APT) family kinase protein